MKTKHHIILSAPAARSGDQTLNNPIRPRWFALALGGFLFTSIFALSAPPVEAQCQSWDVSGKWRFNQGSGQGANYALLDLRQNGTVITGTAIHKPGDEDITSGTVDGTVEGDSFAVHIYWGNNTIGVYDGTIRPSGRIEGKGYEQRSPRTKVNWHSTTTMKCADTAVQPTNPTTNVPAGTPRSSGKMPKTQSSATAPFIKANPVAVTIPNGQSHGTTTLTWDGGPDHPDAEVWRKDSSQGEETLVVQQGKGTRSVEVEGGKNHQFILKDAGQQLARAAVLTRQ